MDYIRKHAMEILEKYREKIPTADYSDLISGLQDIELLRDRDEELEKLWEQFADIPLDPKTECIDTPFLGWGKGISREEIWHWFDQRHSKGVVFLLYGEDAVKRTTMMAYYESICQSCETKDCAYNCFGECRFPMVFHRLPAITDKDGCSDYNYREGDQ